jgi:hypothetical protein
MVGPTRRRLPLATLLALTFLAAFAVSAAVPAPASAEELSNCRPVFAGNPADPVKRTLTSVVLRGTVYRLGEISCEANWTIEWFGPKGSEEFPTGSGNKGSWEEFPGGHGIVTGAGGEFANFETGELTGLEPETTYYERGTLAVGLTATDNKYGTFEAKLLRPNHLGINAEPSNIGETSVRVKGQIEPAPFETKWQIQYSTSQSVVAEGKGTVVAEGVISQGEAEALQTPEGASFVHPEADISGLAPSTGYYVRLLAEDEPEWPPSSGEKHHKVVVSNIGAFETHGPPVTEAFATPALRLETLRVLGYVVPHGFDTHYRFQYGPTTAYGSETPEEDAGAGGASGDEAVAAGADLPGLRAGVTYHYRMLATSLAGGGVTVHGGDHTVTVPVPGEGAGAGEEAAQPCPNEALRTGASARLPDCRAYEQVTPVEKGGTQQAFSYSNQVSNVGALVGEDGEHLVFEQPFVHWGTGNSPYFFSRDPQHGWQMTPGAAQPEAGIDEYHRQLLSPDLTQFAFASAWATAPGVASPNLEFKAGLPGGPYPTVASVPRGDASLDGLGWVAASDDFSKLILATSDRTLAGHTGTASGNDLYEYAGGVLRQVNVTTAGATIGECGATMALGAAERTDAQSTSSRHAVSSDGRRVFFYAVPGSNCSEPSHLYMRVNGVETVDLGVYRFAAADAQGTEGLLEKSSGENPGLYRYETGSAPKFLASTGLAVGATFVVSEDLKAIYFDSSSGGIYRYDVPTETLGFVTQAQAPSEFEVTPDGRYLSFRAGLPDFYPHHEPMSVQLMLYDGVHNLLECASCASSFNPQPKLFTAKSMFGNSGVLESRNLAPNLSLLTADGRRLFFDTRATLLPSDVDGESLEQAEPGGSRYWSPASDVYEWRANGVEGCVHVQGCLALISSGRGGYLVQLLGADPSGRDVFFTTQEQLVPADGDNSIDIYDARSGGGFPPPPPRPVECAGDACHQPFSAPSDLTPSSATFQGAGNLLAPSPPVLTPKPKAKAKAKCKATRKKKCKTRRRKTRGKKARRAARHAGASGRTGR